MATNEKWEPPPYQGGERKTRDTQASDTSAASSFGVESQAQYALESAHPDHGSSSSTPNAKAKNDASGDIRIVLIGKTGTGKSVTGNTLIGENVFKSKGSPKSVSKECQIEKRERFGKTLMVVDTPGFLDSEMSHKELLNQFISCTTFSYPGIHALLLVFQVGSRFLNDDIKAIETMEKLFSETFVNHTVVVLTGKDTLDADGETVEGFISELPETLRQIIVSCKGGVIAISNRGERDEREQVAKEIISKVEEIVRKNGGESQFYRNLFSDEINRMVKEIINENEVQENTKMEEQEPVDKAKVREKAGEKTRHALYSFLEASVITTISFVGLAAFLIENRNRLEYYLKR